jgi:hypothetical protein
VSNKSVYHYDDIDALYNSLRRDLLVLVDELAVAYGRIDSLCMQMRPSPQPSPDSGEGEGKDGDDL